MIKGTKFRDPRLGETLDLLPQWTEKAEKRGLDPLGIQNSGVLLYQALLPGISNVTLRMRYYCYYCWVSETYARSGASDDFEAWRTWLRKAEALYALVAAYAEETGVGGTEWANGRLAVGKKVIDFAAAASTDRSQKLYLRQALGVFGGAYFSQMEEMGLFTYNKHGIQIATRELGKRAATLFADAIGPDVAKLLRRKIADASVRVRELQRLSAIAPSGIEEDGAEREFYEMLLFAEGNTASENARSRSASLRLVLHTARAIEATPGPEDVRWHLFDTPAGPLPSELEAQRLNWEVYNCQDLMQVAAASLLAWAISLLNSADGGLPIPEIRAQVVDELTSQSEMGFAGSWREFRSGINRETYDFRETWNQLTNWRGAPDEKAMAAVQLMAALHQRTLDRPDLAGRIDQGFPMRGMAHSLRTELSWLASEEDQTVIEKIADYMIERVVRRHSWVAMQKLRRQRDYTFLFEVRDGRLIYLKGYQPVATTPRLMPAIQFLEDIYLLDEGGLTPRAHSLLEAAA